MTSPFCWQPWPNPVSLGPRPKDLHTQVPKSRPLSEKGAELIRKRRIKKVFGSFNKGPFKGKRLCFGSSQNMTHSSPGMCIDRRANPHSFASPSYSCWTSPSTPQDQTSVSRLSAAVCVANFKHSKCNKGIIASFQMHAAATLTMKKRGARAWYPTTRTQTVFSLR